MKKVMTIREFEAFLDEMDNRLEEANKNGRPLIDCRGFVRIFRQIKIKGYEEINCQAYT
jgi:hypothetical protein